MILKYDFIFVGIGLANGLIALRFKKKYPNLNILLIDSNNKASPNNIWSFHETDLNYEQMQWINELIVYSWNKYIIKFPNEKKIFINNYHSITSDRFTKILNFYFKKNILLNTTVKVIKKNYVILANKQILFAKTIFDGRGYKNFKNFKNLKIGYQIFLGQEWELKKKHNLLYPILIDTTVFQKNGYHFVYILPLNQKKIFIEDTFYLNKKYCFIEENSRNNIKQYAKKNNWQIKKLIKEEKGIIPIILQGNINRLIKNKSIIYTGIRAGLFNHTTGYSLGTSINFADFLINHYCFNKTFFYQKIYKYIKKHWKKQKIYRLLNRILFSSNPINKRWVIIKHFYTLPKMTINRFYSTKLTFYDYLKIFFRKPPVALFKAIKAIFYIKT